jgi:hypothetical protein
MVSRLFYQYEYEQSANGRKAMEQQPLEIKQSSLNKALAWALSLVFFDAFLFNQGVLSAGFGLFLLFISVPRSFLRKLKPVRSQRLRNIAIYLAAVVLVIGLNNLNNLIAHKRAELLISAINTYHAKNHRYPQKLQDLTPEFVAKVPRAKYTLLFGEFSYFLSGENAFLFFVDFPPHGRPIYRFPDNRWGYVD